ncbi:hypothetical protein BN3660_03731 [Eubacteriaceae bacterium CHKCI004]|nr:hypothetical protein BN3660_03731 [Eubacteriaceae bacterium CHKCI004]
MKKIYSQIKKNPILYECLIKTKYKVNEITSKQIECATGNHGVTHINRVIEYLDKLYNNYFSYFMPLNEYEQFILLSAVYLHDIGFYLNKKSDIKNFCIWKHIENDLSNEQKFYRKMHPWISAYWIFSNLKNYSTLPQIFFGEQDLGYYIMKIIISHGINFWEFPCYHNEINLYNHKIRLLYLSYLLCLADTLDCDKRRNEDTHPNMLKQYNVQDKIFFRYHQYIKKIDINNEKIDFYICIPQIKIVNDKQIFDHFYILKMTEWLITLLKQGELLFPNINKPLILKLHITQSILEEKPTREEFDYIKKHLI